MKKNISRKILPIILGLSFMTLLVGCGGEDTNLTQEEADQIKDVVVNDPESITATIEVGGWPQADDGFGASIEGFNEIYPNINVELVMNETSAHMQALQSALIAGDAAPDVAMVEGAYIAAYKDSHQLVDLNMLGADELKDDFVDFKWEQAVSSNGERLAALTWDIGPTLYYYRTDIFEEVGLPTDPEEVAELMSTWDGVLEVAEKVSIPGERWFLPSAAYPYQWLFMNRDYFDEDLNLNLKRDGDLECLEAMLKIRENGWDMNVDMWSGEANAAYDNGSIATVAAGSWFSGQLKSFMDPDGEGLWGATTLPVGMPDTNWGGSYLVIPEQSENKEAAWAFVKYMLATTKGQNDMYEAADYFPAYKPAWTADGDLFSKPDPYFGGQTPNLLAIEIAENVPVVYNTIMDTTAEEQVISSFNAGAAAGETPEQIRERLGNDIENATAELKKQQIQILTDEGVWDE